MGSDGRVEYRKRWYKANRERVRKRMQAWRAANPTYGSKYNKKWRADNAKRIAEHREIRLLALRAVVVAFKNRPCADCGKKFHPFVMDCDHREGAKKSREITELASMTVSEATLKAELRKCDVVCANCHRMRTLRRLKASGQSIRAVTIA